MKSETLKISDKIKHKLKNFKTEIFKSWILKWRLNLKFNITNYFIQNLNYFSFKIGKMQHLEIGNKNIQDWIETINK